MEYSIKHDGELYEDVVRNITERERQQPAFAWAEKIVDAAFEDMNAGVAYGISYAGEPPSVSPFIKDYQVSAFDNRPA